MIRINQIKLDYRHTEKDLTDKIYSVLKISPKDMENYQIAKKSIDARKDKSGKHSVKFIYAVDVWVKNEKKAMARIKDKNVSIYKKQPYVFKVTGTLEMKHRPVIIGSGPAGLFCALMLARNGYDPVLIERGADVDERTKAVDEFWKNGVLSPDCNVQFGEGGAGTFSDGKLNTLVKDKTGKNTAVLEIFAEAGAGEEILYLNKPHIGTDVLVNVVKNIREEIKSLGGDVLFHTKLVDIHIEDGKLETIEVETKKDGIISKQTICTDVLVLAVGHSARDTFTMLYEKHMAMEQKPFAIGVRVEHPQTMINKAQYGIEKDELLPAADYKLTYTTEKGRSVYTFCMCPGGHVVNASSEAGYITVNGMSYQARNSENANSAVIVNVTPDDFGSDHPLAGVEFQRRWEMACFDLVKGQNNIPVQLFGDFEKHRISGDYGRIKPVHKGQNVFADLHHCLPDYVCDSLIEGMHAFGQRIRGFDREDTVMSGIEARTSSPLRMVRNNDTLQSNLKGIFPCGEGAGYAGGITSAAMDGIRVAEAIASIYMNRHKG